MSFVRHFGKLRASSIKVSLLGQNINVNARCFASTPWQWTSIQANKNQAATAMTQKVGRKDPLDTSFNDPTAAFKSKTTFELVRAYFVYMLCSSEYLVENNMKVSFPHFKFPLLSCHHNFRLVR